MLSAEKTHTSPTAPTANHVSVAATLLSSVERHDGWFELSLFWRSEESGKAARSYGKPDAAHPDSEELLRPVL